jgi:D-alanine-D-alanine ligase
MGDLACRTDLPVLMLFDVDPAWPQDAIGERLELAQRLSAALQSLGHPVCCAGVETDDLDTLLVPYDPEKIIVFNWCEDIPGTPHSGARAAQKLEMLGFTYTGADFYALTLGQDKRKIKERLKQAKVPTPAWEVFTSARVKTWRRFPAIVKPAFEHCSFGITREAVVQTPAELARRVSYVVGELCQPAIVEDFIDGREFHVGVFGNGTLRVLPPGEIEYGGFHDIHDRLCTYESNVDKSSLAYRLTAPRMTCTLSEADVYALNDVVTRAYRATDCRDYARMDIRLQDGIYYVLDVNHNADIGPETSLVLGAEKIGYSYGQFGSCLVNLAAQRHQTLREGRN